MTPVSAVGAPDVSADLRWAPKSGDRRRLFQNRQSGPDVRHPGWRRERGFPTAADNVSSKDEAAAYIAEGLRIYVVRTTGNTYYAGFLLGGYPDDWPADEELVRLFTGDGGVSEFPSGLLLDPDNQTRPFSTEDESIASETRVLDPGENADPDLPGTAPEESTVSRTAYASTELAAKVDAIAMSLGLRYAQESFRVQTSGGCRTTTPVTTFSSQVRVRLFATSRSREPPSNCRDSSSPRQSARSPRGTPRSTPSWCFIRWTRTLRRLSSSSTTA